MQKIKEYLLITIGVALTAIALEYFFFPCDIAAGGVSGIGLVINKVFGLDTSVVILVLNVFSKCIWINYFRNGSCNSFSSRCLYRRN